MTGPPHDFYCTPDRLAWRMIGAIGDNCRPARVADFAAGDGKLLKIAEENWPDSSYVAVDISKPAVDKLRRWWPHWHIGRCDFLVDRSRRRTAALRSLEGEVDVVLLNPPFSCRGKKYFEVDAGERVFRCGRAMAFVLTSFRYLATDGILVAVLPNGCLVSDKDAPAWEWLRRSYTYRVIEKNGRWTFAQCAAETTIVVIKRRRSRARGGPKEISSNGYSGRVTLALGRIQMHSLNGSASHDGLPLIHTTDLRNLRLSHAARRVQGHSPVQRGPAVLIPRVGQPDVMKISVIPSKARFVLSDCVFAVGCTSAIQASDLKRALIAQWDLLRRKYGGTGAPYITSHALAAFLGQLGYEVADDEF
jgi:hypothetical protein